jgi:hypothetical protein
MPHVASKHEQHHGKAVGNGHCVAFVREVTGLPPTAGWRRGELVRGSGCAPGTAIATFDPNGRYGNHTDGRSHAAILLAEQEDGLLVLDQWKQQPEDQPVHQRLIRYRGGVGKAVNDGDRFHTIEVAG